MHHPTFAILPHRARVPPHDHIKRQIKLARNSISNSDSFSRSLTATSISAFVLSLARSGQGQSFRLGRPHVRIAGGNLYMGGSLRSSSTSISTAYRRGCVVRSSPRPCYFCATSCPCSKKLSRSSTRDRTALFIEHIVSEMTASALVRLVPTVPCCRARRHCVREPHLSHMPSGFARLYLSARAVKCSAARVIPRTHTRRPRSPTTLSKARRSIAQHATRPSLGGLSILCCALLFSKPHSGAVCLLITKPNTTPILPWPPTRPPNRVSAGRGRAGAGASRGENMTDDGGRMMADDVTLM